MSVSSLSIQSHDPPHQVRTGFTEEPAVHIQWGDSWLHLHRPLDELETLVADLDAAVTALRAARVLGGQPSLYAETVSGYQAGYVIGGDMPEVRP